MSADGLVCVALSDWRLSGSSEDLDGDVRDALGVEEQDARDCFGCNGGETSAFCCVSRR